MITKSTRSAIWKSGIIAMRIAFKTIWRPFLKRKFVSYFQKTKNASEHLIYLQMFLKSYWIDLLGIPDRNLSGRRTRKARNAFASKPLISRMDNAMSKNL